MVSFRTMWSLVVVVVVVAASLGSSGVHGRSVEGSSRMERLLSSGSSSSEPLSFLSQDQSVNKRQVFDQACKGIYDRAIFKKLDRVCEDCYNLYRKPYVATTCRQNCYANSVFRQCLDDLLLIDVVDEYISGVQTVGK
ncbi:crustacean hyperglycemic hormones-like isoform X1 [Procambarus clarkii]|uniref:Crustacean hyperglycemic hormones n=3 Tax=Procambarus TaxID=6726 RepID=CHH_PROCL|nr:crustacean hyperglycemic hormones [Procambarus clarkii]XP_045610483.1 crustacean hyperglycemic hormones isoform X1 [Procambarus clarkii]XP_045610485.1 crustacean hyperglycemic hormones [Procambarus clarkii]Q25683.3 RecName: Full=Crustacean hyperglycemic hormones; Contains: RecName: Full=CHH precursor-related peptide; Short=CPRP; Contains: RecName: Full=Crustacean hyperglycemic hormone; Short=CHH; Flags: Precursor [Procambarus clarkii]AAL79194.1 eyestalk-specific CHH-like protein precursor [P